MNSYTIHSILDLSPQLKDLAALMTGGSYGVEFYVKRFDYSGVLNFDGGGGALIWSLFKDEVAEVASKVQARDGKGIHLSYEAAGVFEKVPYDKFLAEVWIFFAFVARATYFDELVGSHEQKERAEKFWAIVSLNFKLPPEHCIRYYAARNDFFYQTLPWGCCALLVNQQRYQALFVFMDGWF